MGRFCTSRAAASAPFTTLQLPRSVHVVATCALPAVGVTGPYLFLWRQVDFEKALDHGHCTAVCHREIAICHTKLGQPARGIESYRAALSLQPDHAESWLGIGGLQSDLGVLDLASFDSAIAAEATNLHALRGKGEVLYSFGRIDAAIEAFRRAVEAHPGDVPSRRMLALCLQALGEYEECISVFESILNIEEEHSVSAHLVVARKWQAKLDAGLDSYDFHTLLSPKLKEAICYKVFHPWQGSTGSIFSPDDVEIPTTRGDFDRIREVLGACSIGDVLQYHSPGFAANLRQQAMGGLATLEMAQSVGAAWSVPQEGGKNFGWRDFFGIAARWRQVSDPNTAVSWIDTLTAESFAAGFGVSTPLVSHQCEVVRYFPYFPAAFELFTRLTQQNTETTQDQQRCIAEARSSSLPTVRRLAGIVDGFGKGFYVAVPCESSREPGTQLEGTRITLQPSKEQSEGYEFCIRMPGTPERYAAFSAELDFVWGLLEAEFRKGPERDLEIYTDLVMKLYFYWVVFAPLTRGTAVCGMLAVCALHLAVGECIRPPHWEGVQMDWEAILSCSSEEFLARKTQAGGTMVDWLREHRVPAAEVGVSLQGLPSVGGLSGDIRGMQELLGYCCAG